VCYVLRDEQVFIPSGNFVLEIGDRIGLTAAHSEVAKLMKNIGMPQKQPKSVMILGAGKSAYYVAKMLTGQGINVKIIDK
jgi:trk system potassium uptake protein TrkA